MSVDLPIVANDDALRAARAVALPSLVPVVEVAAKLHLDARTVRALVRDGELVAYRIRGSLRIDTASVERFLCRVRQHSPQPVVTNADPISSGEGASGTPTASPSPAEVSPSTPPTTPKRSAASQPSSAGVKKAEDPAEAWNNLRKKHRSLKR